MVSKLSTNSNINITQITSMARGSSWYSALGIASWEQGFFLIRNLLSDYDINLTDYKIGIKTNLEPSENIKNPAKNASIYEYFN